MCWHNVAVTTERERSGPARREREPVRHRSSYNQPFTKIKLESEEGAKLDNNLYLGVHVISTPLTTSFPGFCECEMFLNSYQLHGALVSVLHMSWGSCNLPCFHFGLRGSKCQSKTRRFCFTEFCEFLWPKNLLAVPGLMLLRTALLLVVRCGPANSDCCPRHTVGPAIYNMRP